MERDKLSENETEQHLEERISQAQKSVEENTAARDKLKTELDALAAEQETKLSDSTRFSEQASALSAEVSALSVEIADNRVTAETANSSVEEIRTRVAAIDASLGGRQDTYSKFKADLDAAQAALDKCLQEIESAQNAMDGYSMRFESRSKNSMLLNSRRGAGQLAHGRHSPCSTKTKIKSISELTLSSSPPNFPIPTTNKSCGTPSMEVGIP